MAEDTGDSTEEATPLDAAALVVGIGASAGGLEALEAFFAAVPSDTGHAFVVVQHLSPDFKSLMPELLQRQTRMRVVPVSADMPLAPNTVHVLTAGLLLTIEGHRLLTQPRRASAALEFPISAFFESLASLGDHGVAIVLSGTGSDGTVGAQRVHAAGGLVIVQTPESARFEAMPRGVIDSGCADIVAAPQDMPRAIGRWLADPVQGRHLAPGPVPDNWSTAPTASEYGEYLEILRLLHDTYGIEFEHYKPGTISRRIERRLSAGPTALLPQAYVQRLANDRRELDRLFTDLLVGVTRFFRDEKAFTALQRHLLDERVDALPPEEELRIWSCGCSTGEEAYSLAMLAHETFERRGRRPRLRVLATDVHGAALQIASHGLYPAEALEAVPDDLRQRHFVLQPSGQYKVGEELRRGVIFSAHDVLRDAAFTRIHLVACRNLLIYLKPGAQQRALAAFHFALVPGGGLFLGESEGVGELPGAFESLERGVQIYRKLPGVRVPVHLRGPVLSVGASRSGLSTLDARAGRRLDEVLLQRYLPSGLLLNARFELLHVYGDAARHLRAQPGQFGGEITRLLEPPLRAAVMMALRRAAQSGASVSLDCLPDAGQEVSGALTLVVDVVTDRALPQPYFMVRIQPWSVPPGVPHAERLELGSSGALDVQRIEDLEADLASARATLQSTVEELESTNQELQAGNEELMAANEELQSTNEELHAVNEELYSVNAEHENKLNELRETTADLQNLIRGADLAILFLDSEVRLRMFTPPAATLFPLKPQDLGRDLRDFMPKEADADLFPDIDRALAEPQRIDRDFELASGRWLRRRISPYRDIVDRANGLVLTYLDITDQVRLREQAADQAARDMYRAIADSTPVLMWSQEADGRLGWAGPQLLAYTGLAASVLADGDAWVGLSHPDDLATLQQHRATRLAGKPFAGRFRIRRHDGELRWFQVQRHAHRDASGQLLRWFSSAVDVHDLVTAQALLAERESFLRLITDNVGGLIAYWDTNCVNRFANRSHEHWIGSAPEQIVGQRADALLGAEAWAVMKPHFDAALGGQPQQFEFTQAHADGSVRRALAQFVPDLVDGRVRGIFASVSDVTPLREAHATLERLLDTLPVALLVADRDGRILRTNDEMAALAGNDPQTLRGMRVEDLVPESLRRKHEALRRDYMSAPHARPMGRQAGSAFELLRGDGTTIEVDVQLTPCTYAGEAAIVAVVRDLRTLTLLGGEEAQRADTARSSFLATMSHEIRTPLNAIMGMAQLMQIDSPMERQRERLKGIEDASGHLLAIVNDVLDLAQIESGHLTQNRETFDITDVVERSIAMVADRARLKHLELTHTIDDGVPGAVVGDARRIEQILVNLLSNAVKFTPAGHVQVRVGCREVASDGLQLRVEVQDSGIGIGPDQLPSLFKPFQQLDQSAARRYGGTGLGLAISRHLARAMGGDCGVGSVPGRGSRFWFTVLVEPGRDSRLAGLDELVNAAYDPAEVAEALRGRRLLVVEDDRVNMIILVELLRALGAAAIDEVEDGQQAVEAAAKGRYDLVFMDMQLPGIDGLEATRRLRSLPDFQSVPIVALTANVLAADVARCLAAGMDAHLPKPVVKNDLARALLRWLGGQSPSGGRGTAARAPRPLARRR